MKDRFFLRAAERKIENELSKFNTEAIRSATLEAKNKMFRTRIRYMRKNGA